MLRSPSILTNMAFQQSQVWREATSTICRSDESPDQLGSWRQGLRLLRRRRRFDVVVTMGPRPSLAYGLLCGLLRLPSRQVMAEIFLDEVRSSPLWRVKTALFRWVSKRALGILTNSSAEIELIAKRFELPQARLRFVPMYTTLPNPGLRESNDGSVVSIGRTRRDVDVLVAAARRLAAPVVVVAGRGERLPADLPPNVRVLREIPLAQSHELLELAAVAVAPLLPAERSTGQVFIFEAMAMGKPVVATRSIGTADYIRDGENGLLVAPGDASALANAIDRLLRDPALAHRLAAQALADCLAAWMPDHHAQRMLAAAREFWSDNHGKKSTPAP